MTNYYEEMRNNERNFYRELAEELKADRCRCFLYDHDTSVWLYVITPNNSFIYIDNADFGGYNATYEYTPSRNSGSGARYNEKALYEITYQTILDIEKFGAWACRHYKTTAYKNAMEALKKHWCFDRLIEL